MKDDALPWIGTDFFETTHNCLVCQTPTVSHAVAVERASGGGLAPATTTDDIVDVFAVCHSCYDEYDAAAAPIVSHLEFGNTMRDTGLTADKMSTIVKTVSEIEDPEPEKSAYGSSPVRQMFDTELRVGDVIRVNDREETLWALLPPRDADRDSDLESLFLTVKTTVDGTAEAVGEFVMVRDSQQVACKWVERDGGFDLDDAEVTIIESAEVIAHTDELHEDEVYGNAR
jgi:hypothetical protein